MSERLIHTLRDMFELASLGAFRDHDRARRAGLRGVIAPLGGWIALLYL